MFLEVDIQKNFAEFGCRVRFALETEKCGVFGPSGSGKSTLMYMLAGLLQPDEGHITLNGLTLFDKRQGSTFPPKQDGWGLFFSMPTYFRI